MNTKKTLIILTTAAMIATGTMASAQDKNAVTEERPAAEQSDSQVQVRGIVEKTEAGITLFDGQTTYLLKGEQSLDPFAGKTVVVTGEGYSSDAGMVVLVRHIAEVK